MRARDFLKELRHDEIVCEIRALEKRTSGELRVFISRKDIAEPVGEAGKVFQNLGMDRTRQRNAVLIFVAPRTHQFAVVGDTGVHAKCGDGFWRELAGAMTEDFRRAQFTQGIVQGIRKAGELLALHFPPEPGDGNQLPDTVAHD